MADYLFVYGTLLPLHVPDELRLHYDRLKPVGPGMMAGRLYDLGEFPGAVFDSAAKARVLGQVFELPEDGEYLKKLDDYEEYFSGDLENSLFVRERCSIALGDGSRLQCWVYLVNRTSEKLRLIPGGDYHTWITSEQG